MSRSSQFEHANPRLIVITGGEPFRQSIGPLVNLLLNEGWRVQIETNGTLAPAGFKIADLSAGQLTVVCSPKTGKLDRQLLPYIGAFKYVINADDVDPEDGLPRHVLGHPANPKVARPPAGVSRRNMYVQPADEQDENKNTQNLEAAMDSSFRFGYTLCLQTHKTLNLP